MSDSRLHDIHERWLISDVKNDETSPYDGYEGYFRGSSKAFKGRIDELNNLFQAITDMLGRTPTNWLDLGCGSGTLLDIARDHGCETLGIETDANLARRAATNGHRLLHGGANEILRDIANTDLRVDVISALHLIEHISPPDAEELVCLAEKVLEPNGCFVIETPNAYDPRVMLGSFYRDPTHVRPYPRKLLEFMLSNAGFHDVTSYSFERFHRNSGTCAPNSNQEELIPDEIDQIRETLKAVRTRIRNRRTISKTIPHFALRFWKRIGKRLSTQDERALDPAKSKKATPLNLSNGFDHRPSKSRGQLHPGSRDPVTQSIDDLTSAVEALAVALLNDRKSADKLNLTPSGRNVAAIGRKREA